MGSLSNYAENALANHISTNAAYTSVATLYLALCTADPTDAGTGASMNEVANSGSYARTAIAFAAAASRRITQNAGVTFPTATGSWGTVTHWAILDSATHGAGNLLAYGAFASSFSVLTGNTRTVATTQIYVELTASNGLSNYAANGFLDRMFRNQAFTVSANYAGLVTAVVIDANTGATITEVSGGSYARVQVNNSGGSSPKWSTVSSGAFSNADAVIFPDPTGSWGTIVGMVICDASTTGNLLWYGNDVVDQAVSTETTEIGFPAGDIDFAAA